MANSMDIVMRTADEYIRNVILRGRWLDMVSTLKATLEGEKVAWYLVMGNVLTVNSETLWASN